MKLTIQCIWVKVGEDGYVVTEAGFGADIGMESELTFSPCSR